MIEYLAWCPDRETFVGVMEALVNPLTGTPLARIDDETGELVSSEGVRIDEIGPVVKTPAVFDEDGELVEEAVMVPGHHVNMAAVGDLEVMLRTGMPDEGDVFETTRILELLDNMELVPISEEGVPEGYEGTSGMRIFDPAVVSNRMRVWA